MDKDLSARLRDDRKPYREENAHDGNLENARRARRNKGTTRNAGIPVGEWFYVSHSGCAKSTMKKNIVNGHIDSEEYSISYL